MSDKSERKDFFSTTSHFRSESAMLVNQIEVNDINFPPLTTGGEPVSNTAAVTKKTEKN